MKTKQRFAHLIVITVLLLLVAACEQAPSKPAAPTQATPPTFATLLPAASAHTLDTATVTETPSAPPALFDLPLPAGWISHTIPIGQVVQELPAAAESLPDHVREQIADLATQSDIGALQVAWLTDENKTPTAHLIAFSVPAHGLRLPAVLSATVESLASMPAAQVSVARMQPGLRDHGMPVALIEYSAAVASALVNRQYIITDPNLDLYSDPDSDRLLVLTFSSPAQKMVELGAHFEAIVHNAAFRRQ